MSVRIENIIKRVEIRGILSLEVLNTLEDKGINLSKYIDRDEVSEGNVSYKKFMAALESRKRELGIKIPTQELFKRHYMCEFVGD